MLLHLKHLTSYHPVLKCQEKITKQNNKHCKTTKPPELAVEICNWSTALNIQLCYSKQMMNFRLVLLTFSLAYYRELCPTPKDSQEEASWISSLGVKGKFKPLYEKITHRKTGRKNLQPLVSHDSLPPSDSLHSFLPPLLQYKTLLGVFLLFEAALNSSISTLSSIALALTLILLSSLHKVFSISA